MRNIETNINIKLIINNRFKAQLEKGAAGADTSLLFLRLAVVFYAILGQISNFCFCATSSHELSVCAIFYAFSNNDSEPPVMFQTIDAVIKRSNFRLKKLGEILKNISIQIYILNWNRINQQNTFKWTIWCVFTSFPNFFLSYKSLPSCRWHADL